MTVLVGGMRALDTNVGVPGLGVLTKQPGALTNDFFVNLLDHVRGLGEGEGLRALLRRPRPQDRPGRSGPRTSVDLVFGSNSAAPRPRRSLRRAPTPSEKFVQDFVAAWTKVMELDRFDLAKK
jgi:catalase-peroxidase